MKEMKNVTIKTVDGTTWRLGIVDHADLEAAITKGRLSGFVEFVEIINGLTVIIPTNSIDSISGVIE